MNPPLLLLAVCGLVSLVASALGADTGSAFYGDPPDEHHPWAVHDRNRPQPPVVVGATPSTPEKPGAAPSDAIVLFDGTEAALAKWQADKSPAEPTKWIVKDGSFQCVPGSGQVRTREEFGDCQLHVEWAAPAKVEGNGQGRGNSGIFPMGRVEVQVLDNYNNPTYADGFASSVYGVNPPLANPLRPPGEWQTCDIIFRRPIHEDGKLVDTGYLTVFLNGVLTQDHTPIEGGGGHQGRSHDRPFPEKGPLKLQDHGNPVRYRNIWYRPLPPRSIEGGTNGRLTIEATAAKRKEIAAGLRNEAATLKGKEQTLRLMESLYYEADPAVLKQCTGFAEVFVDEIKKLPADQLERRKGEVMQMNGALNYLVKAKVLPGGFAAKTALAELIKGQGWDKKRN